MSNDPFSDLKTLSDLQLRVMNSCEKYQKKVDKEAMPPTRRNAKPEEDVKAEHVEYYRAEGFFMRVFESKAVKKGDVWRQSGMAYGTPDMLGCCPWGYIHAIELKAPGRRSTLRDNQREFLVNVIQRGGFGLVSDNVKYTQNVYDKWLSMDIMREKVRFLMDQLPRAKG